MSSALPQSAPVQSQPQTQQAQAYPSASAYAAQSYQGGTYGAAPQSYPLQSSYYTTPMQAYTEQPSAQRIVSSVAGTATLGSDYNFFQQILNWLSASLHQIPLEKIADQQKLLVQECNAYSKLALQQTRTICDGRKREIILRAQAEDAYVRSVCAAECQKQIMGMEAQLKQQLAYFEQECQAQSNEIERQANSLEITALQQSMALEHAEREKKWSGGARQQHAPPVLPMQGLGGLQDPQAAGLMAMQQQYGANPVGVGFR